MTKSQAYFSNLLKQPNLKIALVGATNDRSKYGNIIFRNLREKGFKVLPINPRATVIEDEPAWHTIADLPEKPDIINIVVHPKFGIEILEKAIKDGYNNFWFQPGAESPEIIHLLTTSRNINFLADGSCIMVMSQRSPDEHH